MFNKKCFFLFYFLFSHHNNCIITASDNFRPKTMPFNHATYTKNKASNTTTTTTTTIINKTHLDTSSLNKSCSYSGLRHFTNDYFDETNIDAQFNKAKKNRYGSNSYTHANIVFETKLKIIDILQVCLMHYNF